MKIVSSVRHWLRLSVELFKNSMVFRVLVVSQMMLIVLLAAGSVLFAPKDIQFLFSESASCANSFVAFPNSQTAKSNGSFTVSYHQNVSLWGRHILARKVCVKPEVAPVDNTKSEIKLSLLGVSLLAKYVHVHVGSYPSLHSDLASLKIISIADPLSFSLTQPDKVFQYALSANNKVAICQKQNMTELTCDPSPLGLQHATAYRFAINRTFGEKAVQTVSTAQVETVKPVTVVSTSIAQNATVYDKPAVLELKLDKSISSVRAITLAGPSGTQELKSSFKDAVLSIQLGESLVRGATYTLAIDNIIATDGGSFASPYKLAFTMSKGPRVTKANIGASGVAYTQNIVISFDQSLDTVQNTAQEISLQVNGKVASFKAVASGSTITIDPTEPFAKCATIVVKVGPNIRNPYGISGESSWSINSRATCYDSFSIGQSVQGKSIIAYRFGSGANAILYVGGVHGNEQNAKRLMDKWIAELNANPDKIPVNRSIVVIPLVNPDGYAKNSRTNANGINLNRNFPANNWKMTIKEPSGAILQQGGGATPLSEPEANALASYVKALRPLMVMSYHSAASIVIGNDAGNSRELSAMYAAKSGYSNKTTETIGNTFDYDTTGAFEDWLADKQGIPAVLVELRSKTDDEFARNKAAMWMISQSISF